MTVRALGVRSAGLALAVTLAGCGGASPPPTPAPPPEAPRIEVVPPEIADHGPDDIEAPPEPVRDAILHSPMARHPEIEARVAYWREIFSERDAEGFTVWLERMGAYAHIVDSTLVAEELPLSLRYLPIIESGYLPGAVSRASAVGLWQFMAPVARGFGMQVSPLLDERRDPLKATPAALEYLEALHARFDSWFLALAAYNGGPSRVQRLLREHAPLAPGGDSLFLVIAPHLPRETREFVPKLLAAGQVAENPHWYGVLAATGVEPYVFDEVEIPDATSFDVVAEAAGVEEARVRALNPHFVRGMTPRGQRTLLRLPPGTAERFYEAYAEIPPDRRVTVTEHVVAGGETLSGIAQQYGIRTAELQAANPNVTPRRMQIGQRLMVPLEPGARPVRGSGSAEPGVHVVRPGESLWTIARRYRTSVDALRRLNGLAERAVLYPGDRLRIGT